MYKISVVLSHFYILCHTHTRSHRTIHTIYVYLVVAGSCAGCRLAAPGLALAEAHALGAAHRGVNILATAHVAAIVPVDAVGGHAGVAALGVTLGRHALADLADAFVLLAVGVFAVLLAVVVVVLAVEALTSVLPLRLLVVLLHALATLSDALVFSAVGILAIRLAVAVVVLVVEALAFRLGVWVVVTVLSAVAFVSAAVALLDPFATLGDTAVLHAVGIIAVLLAVAVVVLVVEALAFRLGVWVVVTVLSAGAFVSAAVMFPLLHHSATLADAAVLQAVGIIAVRLAVAVIVLRDNCRDRGVITVCVCANALGGGVGS